MTRHLSVDQVLCLTQHQLVEFVKQNIRNEGDNLNISNIADWEDVSQAKRDLLAEQLLTAVQKTVAPSVDPFDLAALLAQIFSDKSSPIRHTTTQNSGRSRSPTVEPPVGATQEYETKCYQALLNDGCRPLFPISLLPQVSTNADAYHDMLRPWTRYPDTPSLQDWAVFSRQLRRWKEFRTWQLGNRRQAVGFSGYLDEKRREFERMGAAEFTTQPVFEQTVRQQWEDEYGHGQPQRRGDHDGDAEAVFSRYAEAARRLLMDHGFVQPFQLLADSKQQDQWTTYVEYLAFECSRLGTLSMSAQKLRLQHDAEWEGLVKEEVVKPLDTYDDVASTEAEDMRGRELEKAARAARSFTAVTDTAAADATKKTHTQTTRNPRKPGGTRRGQKPASHAQKSLQSAQTHLDDIARRNDLVDKYLHNTQKFQTAKVEVDYQQRRVEWVRSEISKIEAAQRTTQSKKRKHPTYEDTLEPQLKTEKVAGESDGPGTRSRKRQRGIHEKDGGAAPSSLLEPGLGAAVVSTQVSSAVITDSRPRRQSKRIFCGTAALGSHADRLKTLRPRVDGKVAGVRGLKTRDHEAARKARGRPRSTHSMSKAR